MKKSTQSQEGQIEPNPAQKTQRKTKNLAPYLLFLIPAQRVAIITFKDFPQLVEEPMINTFQITALNVLTLYTVTSAIGPIISLVAPSLQRYFGVGRLNLGFQSILLLATSICLFGASQNTFWYFYVGTLIYGVCKDGSYITANVMYEKYFSGSWLTLALGLSRVYNRTLLMISTYFVPLVYVNTGSLVYVFWVYMLYAMIGVLMGVWFLRFEKSTQKETNDGEGGQESYKVDDKQQFSSEDDQDAPDLPEGENSRPIFGAKHLKHLPMISWLLITNCFLYTFVYYQFCSFITDFISKRYTKTYLESKNIVVLIPFLSVACIPACLFIIKRYGKKITMLIIGALFKLGSTAIFCILPADASYLQLLPSIVMLGVSGSICSCVGIATLLQSLPTQAVPLMMGIENLVTSAAFLISPTIFGIINGPRTPEAYQISNYIFLGFSVAFFVSSILGGVIEYRSSGVLDLPGDDPRCEAHKKMLEVELDRILRGYGNGDDYELQRLD